MSRDINKFKKGLGLTPEASININEKGELQVDDVSGKLNYHDGVGTSPVVTESGTATLTNKTIDGDNNTVQDLALGALKPVIADANKVLRRDASGVVVADNAIPNASAIVTTDATQTLTNKTIDGDNNTIQDLSLSSLKDDLANANKVVSRNASGQVISGNNLPNTSDLVTIDSTQTLTNKTIDGDNNTVQDLGLASFKTELADADKVIRRNASGVVISGNAIPNSSNLVTTDAVQVLTGKDIDGGTASNTSRITLPKAAKATLDALTRKEGTLVYDTDADKVLYDDGSILKELGSGSGASGTLYFSDRNAENLANFVLYNDGGATPTDGIGGTPTITKSLNTSTPLIGTSSFRMTHPGAATSRQGQGASITTDIALDAPVVAGEPLTVQFRYRTSSGYASGQVRMFVYFVGPNTLQALNGVSSTGVFGNDLIAETGNRGQYTATTSCPAGTTAVRVIAHIAGTGTAAWDIDFDEITIGTAATLTSPIVTEWVPYTPTFSAGFGTVAGSGFSWRRVGSNAEIRGWLQCGTVASSVASITLPTGLTINTSVVVGNTVVGIAEIGNSSTTLFKVGPIYRAPEGADRIVLTAQTSTNGMYQAPPLNANGFLVNSGFVNIAVDVPITQFAGGTNVISSTQANFFSGAFRASRSGALTLAPNNSVVKVNFNSTGGVTDYVRGGLTYDAANSRFVANKAMRLRVSARVTIESTNVIANQVYSVIIRVNGSDRLGGPSIIPPVAQFMYLNAEGVLILNAGDIVEVAVFGTGNNSVNVLTVNVGVGTTYFTGAEEPDLSVVGISGAPLEIVKAISATKTPVASGHHHQLTGNSVTLTPGVWRLKGSSVYFNSATAAYTFVSTTFTGANGTDTATPPAAIGTLPGITVEDTRIFTQLSTISPNTFEIFEAQKEIVVRLLQTTTIFLVTFAGLANPGNGRIVVEIVAERIR